MSNFTPSPAAAEVPRITLEATFEIAGLLHLLIEQINRYLQTDDHETIRLIVARGLAQRSLAVTEALTSVADNDHRFIEHRLERVARGVLPEDLH